jgi:hypothetical protein
MRCVILSNLKVNGQQNLTHGTALGMARNDIHTLKYCSVYCAIVGMLHLRYVLFFLTVTPIMIGDIQDLHSVQISFRTMPTLHGLQAGHTLRARHGKTISNHPDIVLDITQLLGRVARKESFSM